MKFRRYVVIVFAVIFWIGVQNSVAQELTTTITASAAELQAAVEYWTPERIRAAEPLPFYDASADPGADLVYEEPLGPAGSVPGGSPGQSPASLIVPEESSDLPDAAGSAVEEDSSDYINYGTPNIFDRTRVNRRSNLSNRYPWIAVGKLFFSNLAGDLFSCTASIISPNNIIVTAGHCVYNRETQTWYANWVWMPGYKNGPQQGTYNWASATVLTAWITSGGRMNDVAVINLEGNPAATTGWLGRSWNQPIVQHHHSFGYPANIARAEYLVQCTAESYPNCGDNNVYAMGCDQTFGASGGPWIRTFRYFLSGAMNYVNGVVSGWDSCTGTEGRSYNGARFTSDNIVVL